MCGYSDEFDIVGKVGVSGVNRGVGFVVVGWMIALLVRQLLSCVVVGGWGKDGLLLLLLLLLLLG